MKGNTIAILFFAMVLTLIPCGAGAQLPDELIVQFDFEGMGNAILDSPPLYSGDITAGDPVILGGTWWIRLDDSNWPSPANPQARWNYIFNTYFVHDPYTFSWTAVFNEISLPTKPLWEINHPTNGVMGGTLVVQITYSDWNMNEVLDLEERSYADFSGTLIIMKYGTDLFAGYCGDGSYNGSLMNGDPGNWDPDFVEGSALLNLLKCEIGTRETTWTAIKSLFK